MDPMGIRGKTLRELGWKKSAPMGALFLFEAFLPKGGGFPEMNFIPV